MRAILLVLLCTLLLGCRTNESPEGQVDDLQITAQVKSKLASDIGISSVTNISVNSTNGVVTLAGQVNSPEVRTKAEGVAKSVPKVVSVVDTGTGISPEEKESIFQPFERGRAGKESDSGGSGVGLAVVDRLVEELGLNLEVYSEYGRGSAFSLVLPEAFLRKE